MKKLFYSVYSNDVKILLVLFVLNFICKTIFLGYHEFAHDEPLTLFLAQKDFADLIYDLQWENNPPLFFLLLHIWIKWNGMSEFSARFLPMLFSSFTAVYLFKFSQLLSTRKVALIATLLFSFSNMQMLQAHSARVYTLVGLLSVASMYYFTLFFFYHRIKKYLVLTFLCNILIIYSHYTGFVLIFIQLLIAAILSKQRIRDVLWIVFGFALYALSYLPYGALFLNRFLQSTTIGTWISPPKFRDLPFPFLEFSNGSFNGIVFFVSISSALGVLLWKRFRVKHIDMPAYGILIIWFLAVYLGLFFLSFKVPLFIPRYLLIAVPAFYALISISVYILFEKNKIVLNVVYCGLIILMAATFNLNTHSEYSPSKLTNYIHANKTSQTLVILAPPWLDVNLAYSYDIAAFRDYKFLRTRLKQQDIWAIHNLSDLDTANANTFKSIIFIDGWAALTDPDHTIEKYLERNFPVVLDHKTIPRYAIKYRGKLDFD